MASPKLLLELVKMFTGGDDTAKIPRKIHRQGVAEGPIVTGAGVPGDPLFKQTPADPFPIQAHSPLQGYRTRSKSDIQAQESQEVGPGPVPFEYAAEKGERVLPKELLDEFGDLERAPADFRKAEAPDLEMPEGRIRGESGGHAPRQEWEVIFEEASAYGEPVFPTKIVKATSAEEAIKKVEAEGPFTFKETDPFTKESITSTADPKGISGDVGFMVTAQPVKGDFRSSPELGRQRAIESAIRDPDVPTKRVPSGKTLDALDLEGQQSREAHERIGRQLISEGLGDKSRIVEQNINEYVQDTFEAWNQTFPEFRKKATRADPGLGTASKRLRDGYKKLSAAGKTARNPKATDEVRKKAIKDVIAIREWITKGSDVEGGGTVGGGYGEKVDFPSGVGDRDIGATDPMFGVEHPAGSAQVEEAGIAGLRSRQEPSGLEVSLRGQDTRFNPRELAEFRGRGTKLRPEAEAHSGPITDFGTQHLMPTLASGHPADVRPPPLAGARAQSDPHLLRIIQEQAFKRKFPRGR